MTAPPCRTLAEYVRELVSRLAAADPAASTRLRAIVGSRSARVTLDAETVIVRFGARGLSVRAVKGGAADGSGHTDRATTLDLLDGYVEVTEAVLAGRLELTGSVEDVSRMGQAIELLLDVAARAPGLQALGDDYRRDPCRPPATPRRPPRDTPATFVGAPSDAERALLARHDLLPP
jgi:hypothetical protein